MFSRPGGVVIFRLNNSAMNVSWCYELCDALMIRFNSVYSSGRCVNLVFEKFGAEGVLVLRGVRCLNDKVHGVCCHVDNHISHSRRVPMR